MATVKLIEYEEAGPEVRAVYDDIMATRKIDWVNNFWKAIAVQPELLRRTWQGVKEVTAPGALDAWIEHLLAVADYAYANRLLWTPVWHPYSHYVHDPENRVLPALLKHCAGKPEPFPVCTLRDIVGWLEPEATA